jgi:hypothetical protein
MALNQVTIADIRTYMRDIAGRNDLLNRVEFQDTEIVSAMRIAIDMFNAIPPLTIVSGIPLSARFVLLAGTAATLLTSEAMAQVRNQLNYSDNGLHVGVDDKMAPYQALAGEQRALFDSYARDIKIAMNAEAAYGGAHSGYITLPFL